MAIQPMEHPIQKGDWMLEDVAIERAPGVAAMTAPEHAWIALLDLMQHCDVGRLIYYSMLKRALDVALALVMLVVLFPLLVLVVLAIRFESRGPIIFRQMRIGKHGRPFVIYKFRTMIPDRRRQSHAFEGEDRRKRHKTPNDPRVTWLGRLLRRTSIDELPQLINVLRGEMSLIGPRPELPEIVSDYQSWQHQRHLVRPGMTGWWQVQGRSDLPMHEHTDLDLYYVVNVSLWFDLQILLRTIHIVVFPRGAFGWAAIAFPAILSIVL